MRNCFFRSGLLLWSKGQKVKGGCVIYIPTFLRDTPVFPLPPPPLSQGWFIKSVRTTRSRGGLSPQQPPPSRLYCPPLMESQRIHNLFRHNNQRLPSNMAKLQLERNQIFILLRSSFHCINPAPVTIAKHNTNLWRCFICSWWCKVVN